MSVEIRSYSSETFSSNAESTDEYEQCDPRLAAPRPCVRTVVRAATPPPIFKRVFERAPTPDAPVMERVRTNDEHAREYRCPIRSLFDRKHSGSSNASLNNRGLHNRHCPFDPVDWRQTYIGKDDQRSYSHGIHFSCSLFSFQSWAFGTCCSLNSLHTQPSLFYGQPCRAMPSFAHRMISTASGGYRAHPMVDPRTPMTTFQNLPSSNRSYSSTSSFECVPSEPATPAVTSPTASSNVIPHPSVFQPIMYQPMQLPSAVPSYVPPYFIPFVLQRMLFAYGPILTAGGIIPTISGFVNVPTSGYSSQLSFHPLITQQLAY